MNNSIREQLVTSLLVTQTTVKLPLYLNLSHKWVRGRHLSSYRPLQTCLSFSFTSTLSFYVSLKTIRLLVLWLNNPFLCVVGCVVHECDSSLTRQGHTSISLLTIRWKIARVLYLFVQLPKIIIAYLAFRKKKHKWLLVYNLP